MLHVYVSVVYLGRKSQFVSHVLYLTLPWLVPVMVQGCAVHESLKENIGETVAQFLRALQTINSVDTMFSGLLLLSFMGLGHGFFFRYSLRVATDNKTEYFEERRNFTQPKDAIIGLFDAVTGITQGLGEAIQDFEPGLDVEDKKNDLRRKDINQDSDDEKDSILGSQVVVGLFDSLRKFTKQVGKLVSKVGDKLDDRRGDVVRIAGNVDTQVTMNFASLTLTVDR